MLKHNFIKVAAISVKVEVGNPKFNIKEILKSLDNLKASIALFPELSISGYTCGDLFFQKMLIDECMQALRYFLDNNKYKGIVILGMPIINESSLYNCAIVIKENEILGVIPKNYLPNNSEFGEKRYFKSGLNKHTDRCYIFDKVYPFGDLVFKDIKNDIHFAVEICKDMWVNVTGGNILSTKGANILFNPSASNEVLYKDEIRRVIVLENSRKNCGAYVYASSNASESTSETVFSAHNLIAVNGRLINDDNTFTDELKIVYGDIDLSEIRYNRLVNTILHDYNIDIDVKEVFFTLEESEDYIFEKEFDKLPFVPKSKDFNEFYRIKDILVYALMKRLKHINCNKVILGLSGGLDSTMALLTCVNTFKKLNYDLKNIYCISMPGLHTSTRTKNNAEILAKSLGVTFKEICISDSTKEHFKLIEQDIDKIDVTYENTQARIRTLILMNLANKHKGLVVGTSDMSEIALGFSTFAGDQISMYNVNSGLPKTLIRYMVDAYSNNDYLSCKETLQSILNTPISPELKPNQSTEHVLGLYDINDFILYRFLNCGDDENRLTYLLIKAFNLKHEEAMNYVNNFFKRFFQSQYKRSCSADGVKVLNISLNAKTDFKMPSDIKR